MSGTQVVILTCVILVLLLAQRITHAARRASIRPDDHETRQFAADLRRELLTRAVRSGSPVDIRDYIAAQPYAAIPLREVRRADRPENSRRIRQRGQIWTILLDQGVVTAPAPRWDKVVVPQKTIEQARMGFIMEAAEQPRTVNNYQAGVVQIGDNNSARDVTANFGGDHDRLLADLVAALVAVTQNASLPPQLRQAAHEGVSDLQSAGTDPSRVRAVLERLKGVTSVAAAGFEAVRPILQALMS